MAPHNTRDDSYEQQASLGRYTPKNEIVQLNYIQWDDKFETVKPYEVISELPAGLPRTNFSCSLAPPEVIRDIRGPEGTAGCYNLEDNGFQVWKHRHTLTTLDREAVEGTYLPEVDALLKDVFGPGAVETCIFDWRIRSSDPARNSRVPGAVIDLNDPMLCLKPVRTVHVDQSPTGAINRVHHHMGARARDLLKRRFRIVNVWRPIHHTIENFPLAVCDGATVPADRLLAVDHVRKAYVGESAYPLACPAYRWYYLNRQTRDEVLLFKTFDSGAGARARCCPHTSFAQSGVGPGAKPRETIEVRALVFTED